MPRQRRRAVTADDLYRLRFVSDPQISPDGFQIAYVVAWVDSRWSRSTPTIDHDQRLSTQ
ncbi:MAG TPA: hypothetical protein VFA49_12795 [Chloroflexota bacterium]|nr:hypothetical protein [Chloroflexota bacterium]